MIKFGKKLKSFGKKLYEGFYGIWSDELEVRKYKDSWCSVPDDSLHRIAERLYENNNNHDGDNQNMVHGAGVPYQVFNIGPMANNMGHYWTNFDGFGANGMNMNNSNMLPLYENLDSQNVYMRPDDPFQEAHDRIRNRSYAGVF